MFESGLFCWCLRKLKGNRGLINLFSTIIIVWIIEAMVKVCSIYNMMNHNFYRPFDGHFPPGSIAYLSECFLLLAF